MTDTSILSQVAKLVEQATDDRGFEEPPTLVRLRSDGADGVELGLRSLPPGEHPVDVLLGFVAPDDWLGLGVIASGWGALSQDRVRFNSTLIVLRDGTMVGGARGADGSRVDAAPTAGRIPDCIRRALDLPTEPPAAPIEELLALIWLGNVIGESSGIGQPLSWAQAVRLHPAALIGRRVRAGELAVAGRELAHEMDWERLRWAVVERGWPEIAISSTLAAWMDAGMFSREVLGQMQPLREVASIATECLRPGSARRRLSSVLREWRLDVSKAA